MEQSHVGASWRARALGEGTQAQTVAVAYGATVGTMDAPRVVPTLYKYQILNKTDGLPRGTRGLPVSLPCGDAQMSSFAEKSALRWKRLDHSQPCLPS